MQSVSPLYGHRICNNKDISADDLSTRTGRGKPSEISLARTLDSAPTSKAEEKKFFFSFLRHHPLLIRQLENLRGKTGLQRSISIAVFNYASYLDDDTNRTAALSADTSDNSGRH